MTERNPRNPPPTQAAAVAAVDDTDTKSSFEFTHWVPGVGWLFRYPLHSEYQNLNTPVIEVCTFATIGHHLIIWLEWALSINDQSVAVMLWLSQQLVNPHEIILPCLQELVSLFIEKWVMRMKSSRWMGRPSNDDDMVGIWRWQNGIWNLIISQTGGSTSEYRTDSQGGDDEDGGDAGQ